MKTLIAICLDESGSMMSVRGATIDAWNDYLKETKKASAEAGDDTHVLFASFSGVGANEDRVRWREQKAVPISKMRKLDNITYVPRGNTPLFDAVGDTISRAEVEARDLGSDRILIVIQTDGFENASREWTREKLVEKIRDLEKTDKWTFAYLAADQDAWKAASSMGVGTYHTTSDYSHTSKGVTGAVLAHAAATSDYLRSSGTSSSSYTPGAPDPPIKPDWDTDDDEALPKK